jgi:hypothetical protein
MTGSGLSQATRVGKTSLTQIQINPLYNPMRERRKEEE